MLCNYHLTSERQVHQQSLEEESSSSSDNSGFFSESCSCSTESSHRDSSSIEDHISGDWEHDYWNSSSSSRNMNLNSSDSDTSSTSSFPSPVYTLRTNGGYLVEPSRSWHSEDDHKVSKERRNLDCSCSSCRVTNLCRLGGQATNPTFRRSTTRGISN